MDSQYEFDQQLQGVVKDLKGPGDSSVKWNLSSRESPQIPMHCQYPPVIIQQNSSFSKSIIIIIILILLCMLIGYILYTRYSSKYIKNIAFAPDLSDQIEQMKIENDEKLNDEPDVVVSSLKTAEPAQAIPKKPAKRVTIDKPVVTKPVTTPKPISMATHTTPPRGAAPAMPSPSPQPTAAAARIQESEKPDPNFTFLRDLL